MRRRQRKKRTMPFFRRLKKRDWIESDKNEMRQKFRLFPFFNDQSLKSLPIVLVQHGWKNRVICYGENKQALKQKFEKMKCGMRYRKWQIAVARVSRDSDLNRRRANGTKNKKHR